MLREVISRLVGGAESTGLLPEASCLVGRASAIPKAVTAGTRHVLTRNSLLGPYPEGLEVVAFGMGCFWCSEGHFAALAKSPTNGIFTTLVGYSQGVTQNPTYEEICSGQTNHVEVVKIVYDPRLRPFHSLLKDFWELHDPTTLHRQGNDAGTQYRSGIYYTTPQQKEAAEQTKISYQKALNERGIAVEIVTEIEPLKLFYPAEDYHQQYDFKPGSRQYCGLRPTGMTEVVAVEFPRSSALPPEMIEAIDNLGISSSKAQNLKHPITTCAKLRLVREPTVVYLLRARGQFIGLLKIGIRKLFFHNGHCMTQYTPICVLDLYVAEQRKGFGKRLFEAMLADQCVAPGAIAYDRPSHSMFAFLRTQIGLKDEDTYEMEFFRAAGMASSQLQQQMLSPHTAVVSSSMESCLNSVDCFGRALALDNAYRHLTSAEQYLLDAQKMQDSAPHTDVAESALRSIDRAKEWLRPYTVAPDNASDREPPVCIVPEPKTAGIDPITFQAVAWFDPLFRKYYAIKFLSI